MFSLKTFRSLLGLILLSVLVGCGNKTQFGLAEQSVTFRQSHGTFKNQLDILWVIDNSGSMGPLQSNLTSNFSSFISNFQSKHYDFQMAVTTTDAYKSGAAFSNNPALARFRDGTDATSHTGVFTILPTTPNLNSVFVTNATQGAAGSGDERAFSSMKDSLASPLNLGFVRPGSFLAVIILSDEDDFSGDGRCELCGNDHDYSAPTLDPVSNYISFLDQITSSTNSFKSYNVSAIAVLDSTCQSQHVTSSPSTIIGQRYIQLANQTNGILGSICDPSFASALDAIQSRILELSTQFV